MRATVQTSPKVIKKLHQTCKYKNYCRSIRREENSKVIHFMHKTDEAVLSLLTGNPSTDDNFAAIFCSLERTPSNKLNFPYPDINKFILHTLQKLFTLCTLFTDVNLFTGIIKTLLTKFAIPQFDSISRRFTQHCPTCRHVQLRKQTDPTKTGLASYLVSKSHGSEVRNCRDQRVFFPARHDRGFVAQFSPQTTGKKKPSGTQGNVQVVLNYFLVGCPYLVGADYTSPAGPVCHASPPYRGDSHPGIT